MTGRGPEAFPPDDETVQVLAAALGHVLERDWVVHLTALYQAPAVPQQANGLGRA